MSKSSIDWCDWSWNPITGCYHDCSYCYARKIAQRFAADYRHNINDERCIKYSSDRERPLFVLDKPFISRNNRALATPFGFYCTFHKYRLNDISNLKQGRKIFVGSMSDVFGEWVPDEWINEIFEICKDNPQHNYLFLTKNPSRYYKLNLPRTQNMWYGYTTDTCKKGVFISKDVKTFISIEPLLEDVGKVLLENWTSSIADWIIVGAETGNQKEKVIPPIEWINHITEYADKFNIPIFMKNSLIEIVGEENMRREFPKELKEKRLSGKKKEILCSNCMVCNDEHKKSDMTAILSKKGRKESAIVIGYMCNDCYENFLKGINNENDGKGSESIRLNTSSG